jgi:hypothetical protein
MSQSPSSRTATTAWDFPATLSRTTTSLMSCGDTPAALSATYLAMA